MIDPKYAAAVMVRVMQTIRLHYPEMPAQTIEAFFAIAATPDILMVDLQKALNIASSSNSRNVALLSVLKGKGAKGLGLVEAYEDQMDRRLKRVRLTTRGTNLLKSAVSELEKLPTTKGVKTTA